MRKENVKIAEFETSWKSGGAKARIRGLAAPETSTNLSLLRASSRSRSFLVTERSFSFLQNKERKTINQAQSSGLVLSWNSLPAPPPSLGLMHSFIYQLIWEDDSPNFQPPFPFPSAGCTLGPPHSAKGTTSYMPSQLFSRWGNWGTDKQGDLPRDPKPSPKLRSLL